jgi:spermidine synthase
MSRTTTRTIFLLFFFTGISSLVYQVIWVRMFGLVFGNTLYAASAVLAAFMAGLALGSFLSGRLMEKREDGLRVYAVLELCIGVCGVLMAFAVALASRLDIFIYRHFDPSYGFLTGLRFMYSFLLLVVPCTFMGATLPALGTFMMSAGSESLLGKLYGVNTLGAFLGCFASGFYLLGSMGITRTTFLAAFLNVAVATASYALFGAFSRNVAAKGKTKASEPMHEGLSGLTGDPVLGKVVLVAYAFSGFAALALEVGWTRSLVWVMGMDSYAFAAMLCVILGGIGLGSLLYPALRKMIRRPVAFLGSLQLLIGLFVLASIFAIHRAIGIRDAVSGLLSAMNLGGFYSVLAPYTIVQMAVSAAILFIPSLLMGLAFPICAAVYIGVTGSVGKGIGNIYSVNTLGGIVGSLAMGFFIIPLLGLLPSIGLMAAVYIAVSLVITMADREQASSRKLVTVGAAAAVSLLLVFAADMRFVSVLETTLRADQSRRDETIVYFKETATGSVLVKQSAIYGKEMLIDGVQVASTGDFDLHSHIYPAHLIGLLKRDLDDVLVIAFGAGGTSGSLLKYPEVKRLDVVEICEGVIDPARKYFSDMNSGVFADPRLNLVIQDGKNYIKMTDRRYDVIYSGPIHPQSNQGSAALYTKEYFEDCRSKLKQGGLQCLWLPLHMSSPADFLAIVRAYMEVYPHVMLWQMPETETSESHPHLIGSMVPILPDYGIIAARLSRPEIMRDIARLRDAGFTRPGEFISQLAMDRSGLERLLDGFTRVNTDDTPSVEFYKRPFNVQIESKRTQSILCQAIEKIMENPEQFVRNVPPSEKPRLGAELARLFDGNRALIKGHAFYVARLSLQPDPEMLSNFNFLIISSYSRAYRDIPESTYLKKFFEENGLTPLKD